MKMISQDFGIYFLPQPFASIFCRKNFKIIVLKTGPSVMLYLLPQSLDDSSGLCGKTDNCANIYCHLK